MLLIKSDLLKIAPTPSPFFSNSLQPFSELYSCYDAVLAKLENITPHISSATGNDDTNISFANASFENWLIEYADKLPKILTKTEKEDSFPGWIDWAVRDAWIDHSRRLGGLFNKNMINILSIVLSIQEEELNNLLKKTMDVCQVKKWSKGSHDKDFDLAKEAYVASTIIRGKYHEILAGILQERRTRHPIRKHLPIETSRDSITTHSIPIPLVFLTNIINKNSMVETNSIKRISLWLENISKTRYAYKNKKLDNLFYNNQKISNDEALCIVERTVDDLDLRLHTNYLETVFEYMAILGITVSSYYLNFPWAVSAATGIITWELEKKTSFGRRIAKSILCDEESIRILAESPPGLIMSELCG